MTASARTYALEKYLFILILSSFIHHYFPVNE